LSVGPDPAVRIGVGSATQLGVTATFADLTTADVTSSSTGTAYRTSNPDVVTVSADGLVTGVAPGTAIGLALNDGAAGFAGVTVLSAPVVSLSSSPSTVSIAISPLLPTPSAPLKIIGTLGDSSTLDLTGGAGITYQSSSPGVAQVTPSGVIIGQAPGAA